MIVFYIIAAVLAGLLLSAVWMPKTFNIEKTIVINQSLPLVMDHIADLNHYSMWNPWQQTDPSTQMKITGTPKTIGHRYEWTGKKVGTGSLTLIDIDEKHIHFDLQFLKPWKSSAKDNWLLEPWGDNGTKITWQNSGGLPWPVARLVGPMLTRSLNKQFETGLKNLKALCEGTGTAAVETLPS